MQLLLKLIRQCEEDTQHLLGHAAADRLGNWRRHTATRHELVEYIQRLIWGENSENGKRLDQQDGLSLERIVLAFPDLFGDADLRQARATLGIANFPSRIN
jgi:hypothetical protein